MERFTVEETNLIYIYLSGTRRELIGDITLALPDIENEDMRELAHGTIAKLEAMTDAEFAAQRFTFTDE
ncbi:Putative tranposon-transfer assisting protein [Lachnospiraceae bacterium NLAE-zl-G231]|uniref:transposon-transfer assisting family protein n=1 Tax=Enterocloster bolteae TaxID=208479 RepID=UPI0008E2B168|nr:Putative tranposon-transfer assisting protein [Lachnospiraceae bacterium NLAE-zl-G231]